MSIYGEKERRLKEAFIGLIEDDSSDEEEKPTPIGGTPPAIDDKKGLKVQEDHSKTKEVTQIDLLDDDDDDCVILSDSSNNEVEELKHSSTLHADSLLSVTSGNQSVKNGALRMDPDGSSIEDEDFRLKIYISGEFTQIDMTYKTKLSTALDKHIADLGKKGKTLALTDRVSGKDISIDESPHSLNLRPCSLLSAIEVSSSSVSHAQVKKVEDISEEDVDAIMVKLQDGHRKHLKEYKINKHHPIVRLKEMWSKDYQLDASSITLYFDGDPMSDDATPEDCDIDDGCVIDVMIVQNK